VNTLQGAILKTIHEVDACQFMKTILWARPALAVPVLPMIQSANYLLVPTLPTKLMLIMLCGCKKLGVRSFLSASILQDARLYRRMHVDAGFAAANESTMAIQMPCCLDLTVRINILAEISFCASVPRQIDATLGHSMLFAMNPAYEIERHVASLVL
jgi:hypothetical protein